MSSLFGYALFGAAVRFVQLGIQMRAHIPKDEMIAYPIYCSVAIGAGLLLDHTEKKHLDLLELRKQSLLEKRRRRDEAEKAFATQREAGTLLG